MKTLNDQILEHPFVKGMGSRHLEILRRDAAETRFEKGQVIFREGEAAYQFYLLVEGKVALEAYLPGDDNIPLETLGAGDVLGWSWLFQPYSLHFQARALEPTRAIFLDGARLLVACEQDHDFGYELMKRTARVLINRLQAVRSCLCRWSAKPGGPRKREKSRAVQLQPNTDGMETRQTLLAEHPFLQGMSPRHLRLLADCAMETDFRAGQTLFREGEMANRLYLIQKGQVILESPDAENGPFPIQILGAGDVLGWSWLFAPYYWHFDAHALEPTQAIFLYGTRLREECEQDHELGYQMMKRVAQVVIQRLQATRQQLAETITSQRASAAKAHACLAGDPK
jgi:CRP-like cAMP-binding protein